MIISLLLVKHPKTSAFSADYCRCVPPRLHRFYILKLVASIADLWHSLWLNSGCKPVTEQSFLVKFGGLLGTDGSNSADRRVCSGHDACVLCVCSVVDTL